MLNYKSVYKHYCDTNIKWLPSDTEELYKQNLINRRELLEQNNWIDANFTYSFNSEGFRSERFTKDPTIMFLGCSNTIGIGLPYDKIWPTLVAQRLNMRSANLGQGGGSSDTAFRLCLGLIDKVQPKILVFLQPPGIRWELLNNQKIEFLGVPSKFTNPMYESYANAYWSDDNNHYFNTEKNTLAIQRICEIRKIKFLKLSGMPIHSQADLARDLQHAGVKSHQLLADQACNQL